MKRRAGFSLRRLALLVAALAAICRPLLSQSARAANTADNVTNGQSDLTAPGTYSGGSPTTTSDVTFTNVTYSPTAFTLNTNTFNLTMGTLDDLSATALTINNTDSSGTSTSTITLNGGINSVAPLSSDLLYVASGGTLSIGTANTSGDTLNLALAASGNFDIAGTANIGSVISGAGFGLTKTGGGNLTLNGAAVNTFTGGVALNGGTLTLNFANLATPTNLIGSSNALTLGGGTLSILGKNVASAASSQTFNGTTLNAGANFIAMNRGASATSATLNLGAVTRNPGSVVIFQPTTTWVSNTASTAEKVFATSISYDGVSQTFSGTGSYVGAGFMVGTGTNTRYAQVNSGGQFVLGPSSSPWVTFNSGNNVYNVGTGNQSLTASESMYAILCNNTNAQNLAVDLSTFTLTLNGMLHINTGSVTLQTGSSGTVKIGTEKDLVINAASTGGITISAPIVDNSVGVASAVTINSLGSGVTTFSGVDTYTGGTFVNQGTLALGPTGSLANTAVAVGNGASGSGTLLLNGSYTIGSGSGASLRVSGGTSTTGQGTLTFSSTEASTSTLTLNGALTLGSASAPALLNFNMGNTSVDSITTNSLTINAGKASLSLSQLAGTTIAAGTSGSPDVYTLVTSANTITNPSGLTFAGGATRFVSSGVLFALSNTSTTELLSVSTLAVPANAYWYGINDASWNSYNAAAATNPTNWVTAIDNTTDTGGPPGATTNVFFNANAATTHFATTLDGNVSILSLTFNGNTAGANAVSIAPGTPSTSTLTIGSGGITVNSGAGANSISAGVVLGASQSWSNSSASLLTVSGNVTGNGNTLTLSGSGNVTLGGNILDGSPTGTALVTSSNGIVTLGGASTFSGGLVLNSGTLSINSTSANVFGQGPLTINGGTLDITINAGITLTGITSQFWNGSFTYDGVHTLQLGSSGNSVTLGGNLTLTVGNTGGQTMTVPDSIALANSITAADTLTIAGATGAASGIALSGQISNGGSGGATLGITLNASGHTLTLSNANTYSGPTTITAGTLALGNINSLQNSTVTINGAVSFGSLTSATFGGLAGTATLALQNTTPAAVALTIGNNNSSTSYSAALTGSGSLTKIGTGTQTLSGNNTYIGVTSVNAGQLTLVHATTGSLGGTAVTVGNGTSGSPILQISGNYTIGTATTGSLAITGSTAGNGRGTLSTVDGTINTLTLANNTAGATTLTIGGATGNAVLNMEVGATSDQISLASAALASIGSSTTPNVVNITGLGGLTGTSQVLINAPGGLASGSFSNFTLGTISGNIGGYTLGLVATSTQLELTETGSAATPTNAYWSGAVGSAWNTFSGGTSNNSNWRTDASSNIDTNQVPGSTTNVFFYTTNPAATNLATTLGQNFTINSLNFTAAATSTVTIGAGNTLTINAANAYGSNLAGTGITLASGAAAQAINAPLTLGGSQSWINASANTLTVTGGVTGAANLTLNAGSTGGFTLSTASINNSGTITNAGTGTGGVTISAAIGANVIGVIQNSAGSTLTLSGTNLYTNTSPSTGTTITAGTLIITADANLGAIPGSASTDVFINGGTLEANASFTVNALRGIALGPSATNQIVANNGVFTYAGIIANQSGADSLTIASGAGTWNPGGQYTYSGGTTLASGSVSVAAVSSTGPAGAPTSGPYGTGTLTLSGGQTRPSSGGSFTIANAVTISAATTFPAGATNTLTFSGPVTLSATETLTQQSAGKIIFSGAIGDGGSGFGLILGSASTGTLGLAGANTFTGGLTIKASTVSATTSTSALGGSGTGLVTLGDSVADTSNVTLLGDGRTFANPIVLANIATAAGTLTIGASTTTAATFSGGVTGTNNLVLNSPGGAFPLTFTTGSLNNSGTITNANTGTGLTWIDVAIGSNVTNVIENSPTSTLQLSANGTAITNAMQAVTIKAGELLFGTAAGSNSLGTGTITLGDSAADVSNAILATNGTFSAAPGYTNPIVLGSGTTGTLTIETLNSGTAQIFSGGVTGANSFTITDPVAGSATITFSTNPINNSGAITVAGTTDTGTVTISGGVGAGTSGNVTAVNENSTSAPLLISTTALTVAAAGTTLTDGAGAALLTVSGGVRGVGNLILNNNSATNSNITLSTTSVNNTGTITNSGTGAGSVLISAPIGANVTGVVQNSASSTLVLSSSANTYAGPTTVSAGTLRLSSTAANSIPNSPTISVASGGTLDVSAASSAFTLGSGAAAQTLQGPNSGTGAVTGNVTVVGPGSGIGGGTVVGTAGGLLTISGTLAFQSGSTASFTLPASPNPTTPLISVGTLSAAGAVTVDIAGTLAVGTYDLIGYGTGPSAANPAANFVVGTSSPPNQTWTLTTTGATNGQLDLVVTSNTVLAWTGHTNGTGGVGGINDTWDFTQTNWANGTSPVIFSNGVNVSFGDSNAVDSGSLPDGTVTIVSGGVQPLNVTFSNTSGNGGSVTYTLSNAGGDTGSTAGISGSATVLLNGGGTVTFNGKNTYTGSTIITNASTLIFSNDIQLGSGTGSGNIVLSGGTLRASGGGSISLLGNNGAGSGRGIKLGPATGSGSGTIDVAGGTQLIVPAAIANNGGAGSLIVASSGTGGGTLILTATNTYSGATTINSGATLQIGNGVVPGALGSGDVTTNATYNPTTGLGGLIFDTGTSTTVTNNIGGSGSVTLIGGGTIVTLTPTTANTYGGGTNIVKFTLKLGNNNALPSGTAVTFGGLAASGTLDLNGHSATIGALAADPNAVAGNQAILDNGGSAATLTFAGNGSPSTFGGTIQDGSAAVALAVTGGSLTITNNNNTYSGGTSVTGGTLVVDSPSTAQNSAIGTGTITVGDGTHAGSGTLTGNGFIGGSFQGSTVTIQNGGTIAGTSGSTLSILGTLALNSGSTVMATLNHSFSGNANALIAQSAVSSEMLNLSGTPAVTIGNTSSIQSGDSYDVLSYNTNAGITTSSFSLPSSFNGFTLTWSIHSSDQLDVSVSGSGGGGSNTPMNAVNYWSASPPANNLSFGSTNNWSVQPNNGYANIQSNIPGTIAPASGSPGGGGPFLTTDGTASANPLYAAMLAGTNSGTFTGGSAAVTMSWRARAKQETSPQEGGTPSSPPLQYVGSYLISNVLSLAGLGTSGASANYSSTTNTPYFGTPSVTEHETDPFVLQMNYNVPLLSNEAGQAKKGTIYLGWLAPAGLSSNGTLNLAAPTWQKADTGDFNGSGQQTGTLANGPDALANFQGSFANFLTAENTAHPGLFSDDPTLNPANLSNTDLAALLGSYGVDTSGHDVWAVINHNSQFAVVPEPSTLLLAALGLAGLAGYRVRRRRR